MPGRRSRSNASEAAERAWQHAVRLLARRDRSEQELRSRLAAAGEAETTINSTLRRLRQLQYVDDRRFAMATAERAVRRGFGSEYLRVSLEQHGIAPTLIDEAVRALYADEMAVARQVLGRRFPSEPQRPAQHAQAARFLLRRGFPEAVVFAILDEAC